MDRLRAGRGRAVMILCNDPRAMYERHRGEIDPAITRALERGSYILGEEVAAFEAEFARYTGAAYAVGVASGTDALHLSLRACGVGPRDEVITVSHTAVATVAAIEMAGATPVLVDIDPAHFTLAPDRIGDALTPRTKAIVVVHLYGQPADLEPVLAIGRARGLPVVEDCAQAHGAAYRGRRVGSWGDVGCFSFYPTKNLGALGDGGMVVTSDATLAARVRALREYGWAERYVSQSQGWNSRLDELQAAVLRVKLRHLDADNAARQRFAAYYDEALAGADVTTPKVRADATHVYHLYVVRSSRREALRAYLGSQGVAAAVHYPVPVHLQPAYRDRVPCRGSLQETGRAAREILSLPVHPCLTDEEVQGIAETVMAFDRQPARL